MLTSARNRFEGTVSKLIPGAINDEVVLKLASGEEMVATITKESTAKLGICEGKSVLALVKASFVVLLSDAEDYVFSTRNVFTGTVTDVRKGQVATEVVLETASGLALTSTITVESADAMKIEKGATLSAAVKATAVILAVKK